MGRGSFGARCDNEPKTAMLLMRRHWPAKVQPLQRNHAGRMRDMWGIGTTVCRCLALQHVRL